MTANRTAPSEIKFLSKMKVINLTKNSTPCLMPFTFFNEGNTPKSEISHFRLFWNVFEKFQKTRKVFSKGYCTSTTLIRSSFTKSPRAPLSFDFF